MVSFSAYVYFALALVLLHLFLLVLFSRVVVIVLPARRVAPRITLTDRNHLRIWAIKDTYIVQTKPDPQTRCTPPENDNPVSRYVSNLPAMGGRQSRPGPRTQKDKPKGMVCIIKRGTSCIMYYTYYIILCINTYYVVSNPATSKEAAGDGEHGVRLDSPHAATC